MGGFEKSASERVNRTKSSSASSRDISLPKPASNPASRTSSREECADQITVYEAVSDLRMGKPLRWGDINPNSRKSFLTYENAKGLPLLMTEVFMEEVTQQYGEQNSCQDLPRLMDLAVHDVEDGRRFWGQVVEKDSSAALWKVHAVLREAAKVLSITCKPPPLSGKCMAKFEGQWFRGFIFKIHLDEDRRPNLFEVFFVDFGFCRQLPASEVAALPLGAQPPMLPPLPPLALPFQLDGLQGDVKNRGKERLQSLILNRIVYCQVLPKKSDRNPTVMPKFSQNSHILNATVYLNDDADETVNAIMKI